MLRGIFCFVFFFSMVLPAWAHGYKAQQAIVQQVPVYAPVQAQRVQVIRQQVQYVPVVQQQAFDVCVPQQAPVYAAPALIQQDVGGYSGGGLTIQQQGGRRQNVIIGGQQKQRRGLGLFRR